jgi:large subunit ribosomal protein L4
MSAAEKRNALKSALSRKLAQEQIVVLDDLGLASFRTGELARALAGLGIDAKALLVDAHDNVNLARAARNNPRVKAVDALAVNVYDVVDRTYFVVSQGALARLVEVLQK